MARIYATSAQYETYTGTTAPAGIEQQLADASRMLDSQVFRLCWYEADPETGMPTAEVVLNAFADAVCAQAAWWDETGDSTGVSGRWNSVKIGSAALSGGAPGSGSSGGGREPAPAVWDALLSPDLTPDVIRLGEVTTW